MIDQNRSTVAIINSYKALIRATGPKIPRTNNSYRGISDTIAVSTLASYIKKMSGMFFVVVMTEKTSYQGGRLPVFVYFSRCVHPGQNFSS
jgi:hypothetical protein